MPALALAPLCEAVAAHLPILSSMLMSPSTNSCVVRCTPVKGMKRFRYDPYRANVIAQTPFASPAAAAAASPAKAPTPIAAHTAPVSYETQAPIAPAAYYGQYPVATTAAYGYAYPTAAYNYNAAMYAAYYAAPQAAAAPASYYGYPMYSVDYSSSFASSNASSCSTAVNTRSPSPCPQVEVTRRGAPAAVDCGEYAEMNYSTGSAAAATLPLPVVATDYVTVQFKYETFTYRSAFPLSVGSNVVVEGDRGVHMGTVTAVNVAQPADPSSAPRVLRVPNAKDAQLWDSLRTKADDATVFAQNAVKELGLAKLMRVTDSEYQFDQNKLTIFFRSELLVDFRKLQRVLFKEFRCRVWLVNLDEVLDGVVLKKGPWSKMC